MDLDLNRFNEKKENKYSNVSIVNDDCEEFSFSCTSFSEPVDTSKMPEDIYDLFTFNSEVMYLTESLWKELLKISNLESVLLEEDLCYSIIDAANCNTLNKYFLSFNYYMAGLQRTNIDSNSHKNYTDLLDDALSALEKFIKSTLPYLMKNVEHLIFKIKRSNSEKLTYSSFKAENFGKEANNAIHKYLKQLRKAITHFKIENVPDEIFEKKIKIEMEIEESYMNKSFFLEIPINEEDNQNYDNINYSEESYDFDTTTDFYNDFITTTTEGFETTTEFNFPIHNNVLVETFKSNKKDVANFSSSTNLDAEELGSSNHLIIVGSIFTFIGLIAVLIAFYTRKFMKKKQKQIKERENTHLEEEQLSQRVNPV